MDFAGNDLQNQSSTVDPELFIEKNQTPTTVFNGSNIREPVFNQRYFIIATIVCVFGTIGNIVTMTLFIIQKKIKIPTFTGIFCSSIADTLNLILRYLIISGNIFLWVSSFQYIYGISVLAYVASRFHLLIIGIIRYIYISKPFYSLTFTYTKVVYMSIGVWISSFVVAVLYSVHLYMFNEYYMTHSQSVIVEIFTGCLSFFGSLIPITILQIINIVNIRKSPTKSVVTFQKTMSAMLAAIIIFSTVAYLPTLVVNALYLSDIYFSYGIVKLASICLMLGCTSDPFVYFMFSKAVRKHISRFLSCKCFRS